MQLLNKLNSGAFDSALLSLYGIADHTRAEHVAKQFLLRFPEHAEKAAFFSAPGRTEIGGNHTDHQHGCVLCASVNLDMLACAAPNGAGIIRIESEGYGLVSVELNKLEPIPAEQSTTAALIRGVAAGFVERGFRPEGFDAYVSSSVITGSGVSSSAAFEVLVGNILNCFFCGGQLSAAEIAKISQAAERDYYGKPCGLMDQMASSVGGIVTIDFANPEAPVYEQVQFDLSDAGFSLCIIDTGSSHDDLTDDYAAVAQEMASVASFFGKAVLREVPEELFRSEINAVRKCCGDRAVLRARHFYAENRRAVCEAEALKAGDFPLFLSLVRESGLSSVCDLENIFSPSHPDRQAVSLALSIGRELLGNNGAVRVHGGGFAGTVQAFVPTDNLTNFVAEVEAVFGVGACHVLRIRPVGGCKIAETH